MSLVRSFVVRIYRDEHGEFAGQVEDVQSGRTAAFHSLAELWSALQQRVLPRSPDASSPSRHPAGD